MDFRRHLSSLVQFSSSGMGSSILSRWWIDLCISKERATFIFIFVFAAVIPFAYCDDPHILQASHDEPTIFHHAKINITFRDRDNQETSSVFRGKFGINSEVHSVSGRLMHSLSFPIRGWKGSSTKPNHYGCTKYVNSKFPSGKWIALVERGECVFTKKIQVATHDHNASAIVIYNNASDGESDETIMDHLETDSISVFIGRKDGLRIAELVDSGITVDMNIIPDGEGRYPPLLPNGISKTSVLFVSISFIVLMIISLAWLLFYYIQRFRYSHAKERLARRLACAAKKAIAKTPQKTVKTGDKELEGDFDQCAVCIEPYKPQDVIRILPCRHVFHKSCVDPWLLDQRTCPMCKMDILRAFGMQIGGSQESVHADPELGPTSHPVTEEPEVSSSVDEGQSEEVKVLLVPHTCLHYHVDGNAGEGRGGGLTSSSAIEEEEEASASSHLIGAAAGGCEIRQFPPASSSSSSSSLLSSPKPLGKSSSSSSRAEKVDEDHDEQEMKALIRSDHEDSNMMEEAAAGGKEEEEESLERQCRPRAGSPSYDTTLICGDEEDSGRHRRSPSSGSMRKTKTAEDIALEGVHGSLSSLGGKQPAVGFQGRTITDEQIGTAESEA
ncbi:RING finger protein 150 [Aplysia californica]|uniref:RING finger protein 150 n=1 Tax=Aplysia californica TaxID=6500 RepID=A0ABM0ZUX5_APLCA|nr:RING finger protein 150 [Aplysia californica]